MHAKLSIALLAATACSTSADSSTSTDGSEGASLDTSAGDDAVDAATLDDDDDDTGALDTTSTLDATTDDDDGSSTSSDTEPDGPPGYTPFMVASCDEGVDGESAVGPDALASVAGPGVFYSSARALDDVGMSCRTVALAGQNFFGGEYRGPDDPLTGATDIWMRHALWFPSGTCFGYGSSENDGWGATKWMRVEFDDGGGPQDLPGSRLTLELGNFADHACNDTATVWGAAREYADGNNAQPADEAEIGTDAWRMVQWHVHLASDGSGFIRFWLDDLFLGEWQGQTVPDGDPSIAFVIYGNYWNGSPHEDVEWYLDDVIMTIDPPDTLDADGHPYISPDARANDWER